MNVSLCPNATLPSLPLLTARGERPAWDEYLRVVYGDDVVYPVALTSFRWFYRCDCGTLTNGCARASAACNVASDIVGFAHLQREKLKALQVARQPAAARVGLPAKRAAWYDRLASLWHKRAAWYDRLARRPLTASCSGANVPLAQVMPKIWLEARPRASYASAQEAFVGARAQDQLWPSPEFWLAPFGWWVFPLPPPRCLQGGSWVEVIRAVQPTESDWNATFYYHAPGSGIWLHLGRTTCCNNHYVFDKGFLREVYGDGYANASNGRFGLRSTHSTCKMNVLTYGDDPQPPPSGLDTVQRPGSYGNMVEIIDVRPSRKRPYPGWGERWEGAVDWESPCGDGLRAGWMASRKCHCLTDRLILNCAAAGTADPRHSRAHGRR